MNPVTIIREQDIIASVADALQYISYYHPMDYIQALGEAYKAEQGPAAKDAIAQILTNSRMCAEGHRPICQDTGIVNVFIKWGQDCRLDSDRDLQDVVDDGVRRVLANPQSFSLSTEEAKAPADLDDASRIALARRYIETTDRQRREATDCFISMDDLANNSEASGLAHAQAILEFDDVSWNAITSRLLSSRPDRGLVNSYANIVASRETLTQSLRASEEHADALTAVINSLSAEIEKLSTEIEKLSTEIKSLSHANASLADQLTRAGEHNAELSERYREAVQYSERPRLALRVLRTKSGAALRARLHRHRPS